MVAAPHTVFGPRLKPQRRPIPASDVVLDDAGVVHVADGLNNRVQKFGVPALAHLEPAIVSIRDVPADEGGEVFVRWCVFRSIVNTRFGPS